MENKENLLFGEEARQKILEGVEILNNAVSPTIGPKGRCILIENENNYPTLTKDGVSVARKVNLKDKFKKLGCDTVKQASEKTCSIVGDGTSTTILLTYSILKSGIKMLNSGFSATDIKKGIESAVQQMIENLKKLSKPVEKDEEILQIATISANNDAEIGDLLLRGIKFAGKDGIVMIDRSNSFKNSLDIIEGMEVERGFISPYFITNNNKQTCEFEDPYIFISTKKLRSHEEMLPLLEQISRTGKPILFIGEEVEGQFLHTLITNKLRGTLKVCAIIAPGLGEHKYHILEDIATLTGGELITDASGHRLEKLPLSVLGKCKKVVIGKGSTTFIGGKGNKELIDKRINDLRFYLLDPTLSDGERSVAQMRLAKLSGKISLIRVGGNTETEMNEKYDRVEDALHACKAGVLEGIVPGGGVALLRAGEMLIKNENASRDEEVGFEIIKSASRALVHQIIKNTGELSPDVVISKILSMKELEGYDAHQGKYCNLVENGVVDPVLATRTALEVASSTASLLLLVDASIVEHKNFETGGEQEELTNPYARATAF